jgi:Domain of unknown function (DUF1772)
MSYIPEILLLLFIINPGTSFGAGIYETRIVLPQWFSKSAKSGYSVNIEAMRKIDTGRKFCGFVTTIPLTLLTLASLVLAWQSQEPKHCWWLAAALVIFIERIGTFAFFIPVAIKLQKADTLIPSVVTSLVSWWIRLNYVRIMLTLIAWVAALRAFSLPG